MNLNPLRTLVGRMVLVTIGGIVIAGLFNFALFLSDRGASAREAIETAMADEISHAYSRVVSAEAPERTALAGAMRGFGIAYTISQTPSVTATSGTRDARHMAQLLTDRLGGDADVRVDSQIVRIPGGMWQNLRGGRSIESLTAEDTQQAPHNSSDIRLSLTNVAVAFNGGWLNARFVAPGPETAPRGALMATLMTLIVVSLGAALVARQVASPLRDLTKAVSDFGAGDSHVVARVHGPEDVRRASTAFNEMAERLGRQMARQRQMLWALSHDLRTPITALKLRAEFIEDDATRQRIMAPIAEMEQLTEQALSLARAGASEEERVIVDIAEIARTLCGELQDMGVSISAEAPAPVMAACRPSELARAMRNLAENAAKYGGGGVMRVWQQANKDVIVEVTDEGPGVPADMLARLTEPFFRADEARTGGADGAGLGLAIAQAIADSHGGRLVLANRNPRGFSAKLILPG